MGTAGRPRSHPRRHRLRPGLDRGAGWRGFALPALLQRFGWRTSTAVLASITTVWHIPAWFVSGLAQQGFGFLWFVVLHASTAVIMTCLVIRTRSVLVGGLAVHLMTNLIASPVIGADLAWAGGLLALVAVVLLGAARPAKGVDDAADANRGAVDEA